MNQRAKYLHCVPVKTGPMHFCYNFGYKVWPILIIFIRNIA